MKKNIMFIIGKMTTGGAERVIYNLCNTFKDKYNVYLVVRTISKADYIPDVNIIEVPQLSSLVKIRALRKIRELKKELKIHATISFLLRYNIYNYLSKYKDKVIISIRNYTSLTTHNYSKLELHTYKRILKKVDVAVNVSEAVMEDQIDFFEAPRNNNVVIPNYYEKELIDVMKLENIPDEHKNLFLGKTIISSGRYSFQKGQWHLIRAFKKVVEYDKDAKLVLTGKGPLKEYYETLINDLNLQNNVFLLGFVENVYKYMYNSDIYLLGSFYEGMPNVLIEAMACGLPVIATDSPGGTREVITGQFLKGQYVKDVSYEKYGVLIPIMDKRQYDATYSLTKEEEKMADAIISLLKDKTLCEKYKKASEERVSRIKKEEIIKMWEDIF